MKSSPLLSKSTRVLSLSLAIIPAGLLLILILKYAVDVPFWDEWQYVSFFEKFSQGTLSFSDLFAQQNEYRQFFPNLIFVGLGWVTKWDKRYELLVSFGLACLVSFNIYRLERLTVGGSRVRLLTIYFITNLLIFTPVQYYNWLIGMQIVYFMPIACLTTCLVIAYSRLGARAKFLLCMCLATVSTFSSANGILCWVLVFPLLRWPNSEETAPNKRWLTLAWIAGFVVNAALYFNSYHKPFGHPDISESLIHPAKALGYFLVLLGKAVEPGDVSLLSDQFARGHKVIAAATGMTLAILFIVAVLYVRRDVRLKRRVAGWFVLGAYSIMTAILVTIGRTGFGVDQAFSPRYTTFTLFLPVALVNLVPIILDSDMGKGLPIGQKKKLLQVLGGSVIALHLLIYPLNIRFMSAFSKVLLQSKACLLLVNAVEEDCLAERVFPSVEYLKRAANGLDGLGYLRPGLIKRNRVQDFATMATHAPQDYGALNSVVQTGDGVYSASGWAVSPDRGDAADAILLAYDKTDGDSTIFALAYPGAQRGRGGLVARILRTGSPSEYAGWQRSFSIADLPTNPLVISAWALDARTGTAVKLPGTQVIQN